MRALIIHGCLALLVAGCGSNGEDNGDKDMGHGADATTRQDAALDGTAPDVSVDSPPEGCYECADPGFGFGVCQARDTTAPLCVYGDGRLGDTCTANLHCQTGNCYIPAWDNVGFCTVACGNDWDCPNNGRCRNDFCIFPCIDESHCPPGEFPIPRPDMGVLPDAPPEYCYDSCVLVTGVTGRACHADQLKAAGCVFGDYRPGDLCRPGVSPCQCVYFGDDTLGFCSESCTTADDCSFPGECVDNSYCIYTCGGAAGTDHTTCPGQ